MITGEFVQKTRKKDKIVIPFQIPEKWEEITIEMYIKVFQNNKQINDLEFLHYISDISLETLRRCDKKQVLYILYQIREIFTPEALEEEAKEAISSFEFEGKTYVLPKHLGEETIGEYYDLLEIEKRIENGGHEYFPLMMAMLFREEGVEYDFKECQERAKHFEKLPITYAFKARNFFLLALKISEVQKSISAYMTKIVNQKSTKQD